MKIKAPFKIERGEILGYQRGWRGWGYYLCEWQRCECGNLVDAYLGCFECERVPTDAAPAKERG